MNKIPACLGGQKSIIEPLPTFRNKSGRLIGNEEKQLLMEVVDSGSFAYICGTKVGEFEQAFAELIGTKYAVSTSSGTAAIHTAVIYLNPEPGDEIIVSPITDMGGVIPVLSQLAVPVFVDIDPFDQNIDASKIEAAITSRTKAIIVTHIYGAAADMDAIMKIAHKYNLFVIEDCAQAHLTQYKGQTVGSIGDVGCFSFQQSKHMTTGDGGMVVGNSDSLFGRKMRQCMDKGWPRESGSRDHLFLAPNYHMTELQAAVGLAQLPKLDRAVMLRRKSANVMDKRLADISEVRALEWREDCIETRFFYVFTLNLDQISIDAQEFSNSLKAEGVDCFNGYPGNIPLYKYPVIKDHKTFGNSGWPFTLSEDHNKINYEQALCPQSEKACRETIVIWWNEGLTEEHANQIADAIDKLVTYYRV